MSRPNKMYNPITFYRHCFLYISTRGLFFTLVLRNYLLGTLQPHKSTTRSRASLYWGWPISYIHPTPAVSHMTSLWWADIADTDGVVFYAFI